MAELDFIKQLEIDVIQHKKITSNPKKFIKYRKIKLHNFKKKISNLTEDDLPIESLLGSVFLIKGATILEFYSWCDYDYSMYLQINKKRPLWIGNVSHINIEDNDPENIVFLLSGSDTFYTPSNWQYFILQFLQSEFQLYIHK
jgi:hypothetical protein